MTTLTSIAPFFIVADLHKSISYYRDRLGFDVKSILPAEDPVFAIVARGGASIFLKCIGDGVEPRPNRLLHPWARWDAFVHTDDPDSLCAEMTESGALVRETVGDTDDGLRAFEVEDADGYVLCFGRALVK